MSALLPEELLERILAHVFVASPAPRPRASWHCVLPTQSPRDTRSPTASLLVSRAFHRIALPLLYHTIVLRSSRQSVALLHTLRAQPALVWAVCVLILPTPSEWDAEVLRTLPRLLVLDATLPLTVASSMNGGEEGRSIEALCDAIRQLRTLRTLSLRKTTGTYLSQHAPRALLEAAADAVSRCPDLCTLTLSFPLSSDPTLAPLTSALSTAPALRTICTPLPALPSAAAVYVAIAENAALERVCLQLMGEDGGAIESKYLTPPLCEVSAALAGPSNAVASGLSGPSTSPALEYRPTYASHHVPTSLFIAAARAHPRLIELIRAGTSIAAGSRARAVTVGGRVAGR
ncbi:hypothetical protein DFH08DRAFT_1042137 [Mycena albidolilacea]|uniref:F-box domain-containing protein n=1 Tax=Mycena albidolilacea TaxID=1033008 RepID=A0AAD6ZA54_9AGAR|nr:hypothetical protein DFH08DRAFT_1042137 [Mycena albidolilacea]